MMVVCSEKSQYRESNPGLGIRTVPEEQYSRAVGPQNDKDYSALIDAKGFESWLQRQDLTPPYRRDIGRRIADFLGKNGPRNPSDCIAAIRRQATQRTPDKYEVLAFRALLRYLESRGVLEAAWGDLKRLLKHRKSNPDMFVPSDQQVLDTLSRLGRYNRILFCLYLCSGLRKTEGAYLAENLAKLKAQEGKGFVKVNLSTFRKTKTAYFCYLPDWLFRLVRENSDQLSVRSLDNITTRDKLIAAKYARKWFYTKCIELGIPESIADFYEGRASPGIGSNHYLAKQSLADKFYGEMLLQRLELFRPLLS